MGGFSSRWSHWSRFSSGWSLIGVGFHQGGLSLGWVFIKVVSHWGWVFIRVVSHWGGFSSGLSLTGVVFQQGVFSSRWSRTGVGFHHGWSLVGVGFHLGSLSLGWFSSGWSHWGGFSPGGSFSPVHVTVVCLCRVIFRWLATKNLKEMNFDNVEKGSPEEVLMGLKTGTTTYAMVFDTMCTLVHFIVVFCHSLLVFVIELIVKYQGSQLGDTSLEKSKTGEENARGFHFKMRLE